MKGCREQAHMLGEPLEGTAVERTARWLLIQVQEGWAPMVADTASLSGPVGAHVEAGLAAAGGARLQLIRRPGVASGVTVIAVNAGGIKNSAYKLVLERLPDLLTLDIAALFEGGEGSEQVEGPLVLVCSHGVRDRCCAVEGIPVFNALDEALGGRVWQTTHLGGHRFAATLVVLPVGLQFGRVTPDEVPALLQGLANGKLYRLDRFRGRVEASREAQVAEAYVRAKRDLKALHDVQPVGSALRIQGRRVRFKVAGTPHEVPRPYSCGDSSLKTPKVYSVSVAD